MRELFRIVEEPRQCSYLPLETAALEIRAIARLAPEEYADLLSRGYRRFGWQVFRPACPACSSCRSLRVRVREFAPNASERRVLRNNAGIRTELRPLFVTREIVDLYNRYQQFMTTARGWPLQQTTLVDYAESFLSGPRDLGRQWLYFDQHRLIGVALMDQAPGAISLVYCFYDPDWRSRSPGTYSILNQLRYAGAAGLDYAYLGYWIESCRSMSYKARFGPHEILAEYPRDGGRPVWELNQRRS
jgi:arginine-tRNA-protein transferase